MQDGPPSSSDDAKASVTGLRSDPSGVRHSGVSTSAVGGKLTSTARSPSAETEASRVATEAAPVLAGDAAADDEVVLRAGLQPRRQHLRPVGGQGVDPVDLLVDVEVEAQVVEQDDADHGGERP